MSSGERRTSSRALPEVRGTAGSPLEARGHAARLEGEKDLFTSLAQTLSACLFQIVFGRSKGVVFFVEDRAVLLL